MSLVLLLVVTALILCWGFPRANHPVRSLNLHGATANTGPSAGASRTSSLRWNPRISIARPDPTIFTAKSTPHLPADTALPAITPNAATLLPIQIGGPISTPTPGMMAAIGTSQTATAPRGGLVQCVMAVCLDNAVNPNESFIQAQTTSIVSGRDGSTLIPAGSIVRGSVRFDAGTRRAFAEGQWTITVGDQEWVFAGTAVEPSEPLPAADGSGGRGLRTDVLPAKADDNAVTQKAREVIIASQSQTPPGLPGNMPPANWQKEEIARLRSIVQSGDYLFLGRGKPFLLYLSRLIDVRTLQGSVISPIPPREQPAQTSPINDVPTGPYSDLPQH